MQNVFFKIHMESFQGHLHWCPGDNTQTFEIIVIINKFVVKLQCIKLNLWFEIFLYSHNAYLPLLPSHSPVALVSVPEFSPSLQISFSYSCLII